MRHIFDWFSDYPNIAHVQEYGTYSNMGGKSSGGESVKSTLKKLEDRVEELESKLDSVQFKVSGGVISDAINHPSPWIKVVPGDRSTYPVKDKNCLCILKLFAGSTGFKPSVHDIKVFRINSEQEKNNNEYDYNDRYIRNEFLYWMQIPELPGEA
jgi:hypothetical protein